eukprot:s2891_g5.t1
MASGTRYHDQVLATCPRARNFLHGYEQVSPLTPDGSEAYSIRAKRAKLGLGDEEEGSFRSACGPFWPPKAMESLELSTTLGTLVLLVVLAFGIRYVYVNLVRGSFSDKWNDIEMDGNMRTKIDHGDL